MSSTTTPSSTTPTAFSIIGPLTTTFTPSPSCLVGAWFIGNTSGGNYNQFGPPSTSDCLPSGYGAGEFGVYAPGFCPSGYTAACNASVSLPGTFTGNAVTCCPSLYSCQPYSDWRRYAQLFCVSSFPGTVIMPMTSEEPDGSRSTQVTTFLPYMALNAYGVVVASTLASSTSASSAQVTQTPSPATSTIPPSIAPTSTSQAEGDAGLSPGAKAGISLGVIAGCALLLGIVFWFFFYRRRKQPVQLAGKPKCTSPYEMSADKRQYLSDLAGREKPAELGPAVRHELAHPGPRSPDPQELQ